MGRATANNQGMKITGRKAWHVNADFSSVKFPFLQKTEEGSGNGALQNWRGDSYGGTMERRLSAIVAEAARVRERERKQIASDLHDYLGQNLVLATMKLGMLEASASEAQLRMLQDVRQLIGQSLGQVRSLISGLYSHELRDLDLRSALDWLFQRVQKLYDLRCVSQIPPLPVTLDCENQEVFLSALRELLVNVAKHAAVKETRVSVRREGGNIIALVADKGSGFDPKQKTFPALKTGGFGLVRLRERIAFLGGSVQIDSHPGKGTKATIILPMKSK